MPNPHLLDANGRPVTSTRPAKKSTACPQCGKGKEHRVQSGAFGPDRHDVCGNCGYEFQEFTCG